MIKDYSFVSCPYNNTPTGTRRGSAALYESGPPPEPPPLPAREIGVRALPSSRDPRAQVEVPFLVVLTTPNALKVNGISTWVHYTHVRPVDLFA